MALRGCASLSLDKSRTIAVAAHGTRVLLLEPLLLRILTPLLPQRTPIAQELLSPADLLAATRTAAITATRGQQIVTILHLQTEASQSITLEKGVQRIVGTGDWFAVLCSGGSSVLLFPDLVGALPAPLPATIRAPSGRSIVEVAGGARHLLMIDNTGSVLCVGSNAYGQLGLGDDGEEEFESSVPRMVILPAPALSIAAGAWHSIVALQDGRVYVWGSNSAGQLGVGEGKEGRRSPKQLKCLPLCRAVASGTRHSAALTRDGRVFNWGYWGDTTHFTPRQIEINFEIAPTQGGLGAAGWYTWCIGR